MQLDKDQEIIKASENLNTGADLYTFFCTTLPVSFLEIGELFHYSKD
ncbi:MAG: hypothetical protein ACKV1O_15970 [Saprospiraceae bacterium]